MLSASSPMSTEFHNPKQPPDLGDCLTSTKGITMYNAPHSHDAKASKKQALQQHLSPDEADPTIMSRLASGFNRFKTKSSLIRLSPALDADLSRLDGSSIVIWPNLAVSGSECCAIELAAAWRKSGADVVVVATSTIHIVVDHGEIFMAPGVDLIEPNDDYDD